jgi:hypothetical protein
MQSFDIKWTWIRSRITDHIISEIEEILKDPNLTFSKEKQYAEENRLE